MEIINLDKEKNKYKNIAIALGNFDGLHLGHQELIKEVTRVSKEKGFIPGVLLFQNHTKKTINNNKPKMLTTNKQKYEILESLGIEVVYSLSFNKEFMSLEPEEFIEDILKEKINSKFVVVGFDYRFGHKAKGTSDLLRKIGIDYGIETEIIKPKSLNGVIISSSKIRSYIEEGNLTMANKFLGREFAIEGKVIGGASRGTNLGYPTANLDFDNEYVLPKEGVYKTKTKVGNKIYNSMTDIGNNPTFEEDHIKLETNILDFKDNIYGEMIEIRFEEFLRDTVRFNSKEELILQLEKDELRVRELS